MISKFVYPELKSTGKLKFAGVNFSIWKFKIDFILVDNKVDYVLTQPKPPADSNWLSDDSLARNLILNTIDDLVLSNAPDFATAKSLMDALTTRYNRPSMTLRMILFREYKDHRMPDDEHINRHMFRMRAMANELGMAGVRMPDELQAVALLNSLPESWNDVLDGLMVQLDTRKEECSFDNLAQKLKAISDVRELKGREIVKQNKGFQRNWYSCEKPGHYQSDCPNQGTSNEKNHSFPEEPLMDSSARFSQLYSELKTKHGLDYTGRDFMRWKHELYSVFQGSNLEYVLKETAAAGPVESIHEEDANRHQKWLTDDFTCRHLILGAMDDCLLLSFHHYPTAKSLMDALNSYFGTPSMVDRVDHFRKYVNHQMSEDCQITTHIIEMESMAGELDKAGVQIPDELQAVILMNSAPDSWKDMITSICWRIDLGKEEALTLDNVCRKLQKAGSMVESMKCEDDVAPISRNGTEKKSKKRFKGHCYSCGSPGHLQADCPQLRREML